MAIVWVRRRFQERGGTNSGPTATDDVISWTVKTDDMNMTRFEVELGIAGFLPGFYEPHPERPWLSARKLTTKQMTESPYFWIATISYDSSPIDEQEKNEQEQQNPLALPTNVSVDPQRTERAVDKDKDGKAIVNTAGDPYTDNPVMKRETHKVIKCWKYFPAGQVPSFHGDFTDKVSNAALTVYGETYDSGTLMFAPGTVHNPETKNGYKVQKIEWALEWKKQGWQEKRVSAGFQYIDNGGKKVIKVPHDADEDEQERPSDPQLLDENGGLLDNPDNPYILTHEQYEEFDPNELPMDTGV